MRQFHLIHVVVQLPSGVRLFAAPWTVESFDSKLTCFVVLFQKSHCAVLRVKPLGFLPLPAQWFAIW